MASYVVLARKWRPAQFSDIVGQAPVVRTLMNAIRTNRIHQSYLFTGSRGIGKTSIARIFSKVLRCENPSWDNNWLKSCDTCSNCKEFIDGNSLDVIEIDGASNNGVDHVREIRERAMFMPSSGSKKIYIIDEVHMLSTAAFNALLKTLEEPPPHVIFMFATTEPHKIPATILSRCQRFDLRRVTMAQILSRLTEVAQSEGIQADQEALALLARAAEGGMRDALSLLDQVIAFSGSTITAESVRDSIGLIESQTILGILAGVLNRKPLEALELLNQAYQQGHDLKVLTRSLIEYLHGVILAKIGAGHGATLEISENEWNELERLSAFRPLEEMEFIFQALNQGVEWIVRSPQPKIVLDVLLIKCATAEALVCLESAPNNPTQGTEPPASSPKASSGGYSSPASGHGTRMSAAPAGPVSAAVSAAAAIAASVSAVTPAPVAAPASPKVDTSASAEPRHAAPVNFEGLIDQIRQTRPLLASIMEHGSCATFPNESASTLVIQFEEGSYYKEQLQSRVYLEQLNVLCKEHFGKHIQIKVETSGAAGSSANTESIAAKREREAKEREKMARDAVYNHPIIREAQALLGGELGPIDILDPQARQGKPNV